MGHAKRCHRTCRRPVGLHSAAQSVESNGLWCVIRHCCRDDGVHLAETTSSDRPQIRPERPCHHGELVCWDDDYVIVFGAVQVLIN